MPNVDDVKQGIIASKIAAHAADIAKGVRGARDIDDKMADARRVLDWDKQWECALDPKPQKPSAQTEVRSMKIHVRCVESSVLYEA